LAEASNLLSGRYHRINTDFACPLISKVSRFYTEIEFVGIGIVMFMPDNILSISNCQFSRTTEVILDIEQSSLDDDRTAIFAPYLETMKISKLCLKENNIEHESAVLISEHLRFSPIKSLAMTLGGEQNLSVLLHAVPDMTKLSHLHLSMGCDEGLISVDTCRILSDILVQSNLQKLSLEFLDTDGIYILAESLGTSKLIDLQITNSLFTDDAITRLINFICRSNIASLDLNNNDLKFEGATAYLIAGATGTLI
jgi:hypothetical protein